jgi:hypothetical protein
MTHKKVFLRKVSSLGKDKKMMSTVRHECYRVYADERDWCKQYNNFIPVTDTALFSTAMDRGCYNAATNKNQLPQMKTFCLVASFALSA